MSISRFFEELGAPLANPMWSWGAQRSSDGAVFMRVWQDEKLVENGRLYFLIGSNTDTCAGPPRLGYRERLRHIEAFKAGAPCFLVMLIAKDPASLPRRIADFDSESLFIAGPILERDGRFWAEVLGRKPVREVAAV